MRETDPIVFVLDDEPAVREALTSLIRRVGWRVETFGSAPSPRTANALMYPAAWCSTCGRLG